MLANKTIISTRPNCSDDQFVDLLHQAGANYVSLPMIAVEINQLDQNEKDLFLSLEQFDWVVFTSKNGVRFFFEHLNAVCPGKTISLKTQIAVIGNSTKKVLQKQGVNPSLVSSGNTSSDLLKQIRKCIPIGSFPKILLSLGNLAGSLLEEGLSDIADISRINVYNTIAPKKIDQQILERINKDNYDLIILTSPSAVFNLKENLEPNAIGNLRTACIGSVTEKSIKDIGIIPLVIAEKSTAEGLFEGVMNYFQNNNIK